MASRSNGDVWKVRAARNQSLFRAVNEKLAVSHDFDRQPQRIACECANLDCVETLDITLAEYRDVRRDATRFAVLRGHVYPEVELVVEHHVGFVVVEKIGKAAEVASAAVAPAG